MARDICVCVDFLTPAQRERIDSIARAGGMTAHFFDKDHKEEALACAEGAEVLYSANRAFLKAAKNLKWYCSCTAGVDDICSQGLLPAGCTLTNSNVFGLTIAEHTVMTALMLLRQMPAYERLVRAQTWQNALPIRSIHGIEMVMVGTGQIGRCIADRFHALGAAKVTGVNRSGRPAAGFDETVSVRELDALLPGTELLVLAVPGTAETTGLLSRARIALLPEKALVINVGRGSAIDQEALIQALNTGRIAGAALDVMVPEPLPKDHPLWTTKNLILTPHISGNFTLPYTCELNVERFCEDLANYVAGRPLAHQVDVARGY